MDAQKMGVPKTEDFIAGIPLCDGTNWDCVFKAHQGKSPMSVPLFSHTTPVCGAFLDILVLGSRATVPALGMISVHRSSSVICVHRPGAELRNGPDKTDRPKWHVML